MYRALLPTDIHSSVDISDPNQVLIGLEITDFKGKINEEALVGAWQFKPGLARLAYRYRPKLSVREDLEAEEVEPGNLTHEDYHWEITGGGDPADDLADIDWNEDVGSSIRFADLQSFLVVFLPALRDVEADLRQFRNSPLARLIAAMEIDPAEQEQLLDALRQANQQIAAAPTTGAIANAVDASFKSVTGPAFSMDIALGPCRALIPGHRPRDADPFYEHSDDELRSVLEWPGPQQHPLRFDSHRVLQPAPCAKKVSRPDHTL